MGSNPAAKEEAAAELERFVRSLWGEPTNVALFGVGEGGSVSAKGVHIGELTVDAPAGSKFRAVSVGPEGSFQSDSFRIDKSVLRFHDNRELRAMILAVKTQAESEAPDLGVAKRALAAALELAPPAARLLEAARGWLGLE
ncbi:MAG: hypothetical protein ACHQ2Y_07115 [Candidatus Lutacidiplasmatales archaeon]